METSTATLASPHTLSENDIVFERLTAATASKEAGTRALTEGRLRNAAFHYKKVYLHLAELLPKNVGCTFPHQGGADSPTGNDKADMLALLQGKSGASSTTVGRYSALPLAQRTAVIQLYGDSLNNLTLVHLKLGRFQEGISSATAVLALSGFEGNAKALLRRAMCRAELCQWEASMEDLTELQRQATERGLEMDPAAVALHTRINQMKKKESAMERSMCRRMFA